MASIVLLFVLLRIFLHYSENGFFEFFLVDIAFGMSALSFPVAVTFVRAVLRKPMYAAAGDVVISAAGFFLIYFVLAPQRLDEADWRINFNRRQKIVAMANAGELTSTNGGAWYSIPDSLHLFPFFKTQEVVMGRNGKSGITVTFYTDRGLLDHYSAFIYTNNPDDIKLFDEKVKEGGNDFKKEVNWYFIHD